VAERIKKELGSDYEVFFPVNSQLKDIDLVVFNLKKGKSVTVQVKGSRTYGPNDDQYSWITVYSDKIFNTTNKTDFFIFIWHVLQQNISSRKITATYIVIPLEELKKKCKDEKTKRPDGRYHFYFQKESEKEAYDYPTEKNKVKDKINFSEYLNNFSLLRK